jgi:hypothetical protein
MMELTIGERLMLGMLLGPIAADVVTLRIVRDLQAELGFSDEESEELKFEATENGQIKWNTEAPQTKEFEFKPAALRIIVEQLKKASVSKTLTLQQLNLYEKFCPEEEEEEEEV